MKGIILYKSKYGATKRYAQWLSEETGFEIRENSKVRVSDVKECFLQDLFGENCKTFLANVASPNWRKLQSFWAADYQSVKLCRLVTFAG